MSRAGKNASKAHSHSNDRHSITSQQQQQPPQQQPQQQQPPPLVFRKSAKWLLVWFCAVYYLGR
jgi:hypothetical protein